MAVQQSLEKTSTSIGRIQESIVSLNKNFSQTQKTAVKINSTLIKSNESKQSFLRLDSANFAKRREAVRRREAEDIVESSTVGGVIKRQGQVAATSTKGLLGRILDAVGLLMVGFLIQNLPIIISLGSQLISRMQSLIGVLSSWFQNLQATIGGFGNLLRGVFSNVSRFDFTDQSGEISRSMTEIERGIQGMEDGFDEAINLLKQPFDFSMPEQEKDQRGDQPSDPGTSDGSQSSGGTPAPQVMLEGGISGTTALLPRGAKGADPDIEVTDRFGYSSWRGRHHNGIDIGTTGQKGYYVAFLLDGTATLIPNNGNAGNTVEIKSGGTTYKFFHLAKFSIKSGPYKAGTAIGEIGTTGSSTGIHLHYEVHPPGSRGVDPTPYLNLIKIGKKLGKPTPSAPSGQSSSSGQPSQPAPKGGTLSTAQLVALAKQAGMTKNVNVTGYKGPLDVLMGAVGMQESRGKSDAFRNDTEVYGLWQIQFPTHRAALAKIGITSAEQLKDPLTNAKAAKMVYDSQGITAWEGFTDGNYKKFLPEAQKAAQQGTSQAKVSPPSRSNPVSNPPSRAQQFFIPMPTNQLPPQPPSRPSGGGGVSSGDEGQGNILDHIRNFLLTR